jgi:hypothetical protein
MKLPGSKIGKASEIADVFAAGVSEVKPNTGFSDYSYETGQASNIQPVVTWILKQFMVPWLLKVMKKWSEPEFHRAMSGTYINSHGMSATGRDFIADFYQNHGKAFGSFLKLTRKYRYALRVDVNDQVNRLILVLNREGWKVYDHEKNCFYDTLRKIMQMIYS